MRRLTLTIFMLGLGILAGGLLAPPSAVAALNCGTTAAKGPDYNAPRCAVERGVDATGANEAANKTCGPDGAKRICSIGDRVQQIINVLLFIVGAISVIMIILGGIKYVLSNGDSSQITSAKNTILYAVIGLIVALLGYAIVNFVVTQFT